MGVTIGGGDGTTPTNQILAKAAETFTATDSTGRVFTLKKPGFLAQFQIVKLVGAETAKNTVYMNMIQPLIYVTAIDGDPVFMPSNELQLDALIGQIEEHGFLAITDELVKKFGKKDAEEEKAELKK